MLNSFQRCRFVLSAACALFVATAASAVTVSFGGKIATDGDGLISRFTEPAWPVLYDNLHTASGGCGINNSPAGSIDGGYNPFNPVTVTGPGKSAYYNDSVQNVRLNPQLSGQCYGVLNDEANYKDNNGKPIQNDTPILARQTSVVLDRHSMENGTIPVTHVSV